MSSYKILSDLTLKKGLEKHDSEGGVIFKISEEQISSSIPFNGTSSYALTAAYAEVVLPNPTSSFAYTSSYALTAAYVENNTPNPTASFAYTSSFSETASYSLNSLSSSHSLLAETSSYSERSLSSSFSQNSVSSSFASNSNAASYAQLANTASYALTSSFLIGGIGETNTASNLGVGAGLFAQKSGADLQFKSIKAGTNITINTTSTEIEISASGGSIIQTFESCGINPGTSVNFSRLLIPSSAGGATARVNFNDTLYATPFVVGKDITFNKIYFLVSSTLANTNIRIGIYELGANGYPNNLVVDFGAFSIPTNGLKNFSVSSTSLLASKRYAISWLLNSTLQLGCEPTTGAVLTTNADFSTLINYSPTFNVTQAYGALPLTYPAGATITTLILRVAVTNV